MKHVKLITAYCSVIFLLLFNSVQAQHFIHETDCDLETSSYHTGFNRYLYEGAKSVRLLPGFRYTAFQHDSYFNARINPQVEYELEEGPVNTITYLPDNYFNRPHNPNLPVGAIPDQLSVNPNGSANYTIPIEIVPGIGTAVPNIALTYNSNAGNGIVGTGWTLTGLSAITRGPKTIYHNGERGPVEMTRDDQFYWDGQPIFHVTDNFQGNSSKVLYETKQNTFTQIVSTNIDHNNASFEITTKDGIVYEFGTTADSRLVLEGDNTVYSWHVTKITDLNGNYVEFKYYQNPTEGDIRIAQILYTGNSIAQTAPFAFINFEYSQRPDEFLFCTHGKPVIGNKLLTKIETKFENTLYTTYDLEYFDNGYSTLGQIKLNKEGAELNTTVLDYENGKEWSSEIKDRFSNFQSYNRPNHFSAQHKQFYNNSVGNFNNDGLDDVLHSFVIRSGNEARVMATINCSDGNGGFVETKELFFGNTNFVSEIHQSHALQYLPTIQSVQAVPDMDGDGISEIIYCRHIISNEKLRKRLEMVFSSTNYTWTENSLLTEWKETDELYYWLGDFRGDDEKPEILIWEQSSELYGLQLELNLLSFDSSSPDLLDWRSYQPFVFRRDTNRTPPITCDVNGDGITELIILNDFDARAIGFNTTDSVPRRVLDYIPNIDNKQIIYQGDFNADGKTDILKRERNNKESKPWYINLSTGIGFGGNLVMTGGLDQNPNAEFKKFKNRYKVLDLNNDGRSDIVEIVPELGGGYGIAQRNYYLVKDVFDIYVSSVKDSRYTNRANGDFFAGNFLKNGKIDLVQSGTGELQILNGLEGHKLRYIKDGSDMFKGFSWFTDHYKKITPSNGSNTYYSFQPFSIVSHIFSIKNGIRVRDEQYFYSDALVELNGRGFVGFRQNAIIDIIKNSGVLNTFDQSEDFQGKPINVQSFKQVDSRFDLQFDINSFSFNRSYKISESNFLYGLNNYAPLLEEETAYDFVNEVGNTKSLTYDNYGNPTRIEDLTYSNVNSESRTTIKEFSNYGNYGGLYPRLPNLVTTFNQADAGLVSEIYRGYTNTGLVASEQSIVTRNGSLINMLKKESDYDQFSNLILSKVNTFEDYNQILSYTYDVTHRFPILQEDIVAGNIISEQVYNPVTGAVVSKKNKTVLESSYQNSPFADYSYSQDPFGNFSENRTLWSNSTINGEAILIENQTIFNGVIREKEFLNAKGQLVQSHTITNDGVIVNDFEYYNNGLLKIKHQPYFESDGRTGRYTEYRYDHLDRPLEIKTTESTVDYSYNGLSTTVTLSSEIDNYERTRTETRNIFGEVIRVEDENGVVDFNYNSVNGNLESTVANGVTTFMEYDDLGRQTKLIDANAGEVTYSYNAYGDLIEQTDAKGTVTTEYNAYGLPYKRTTPEGVFETVYDRDNFFRIESVDGPNGSTTYQYDEFHRIISETEQLKNAITNQDEYFTRNYTFDNKGRLETETLPNGLQIDHGYHNDELVELTRVDNDETIWSNAVYDAKGRIQSIDLGNIGSKNYSYASNNTLQAISSSNGLLNMAYVVHPVSGNMTRRRDLTNDFNEVFAYDEANRLDRITLSVGLQYIIPQVIQYADNGNITFKSDAGTYTYDSDDKPHALKKLTNIADVPSMEQIVSYNSNGDPISIHEGSNHQDFYYDNSNNRQQSVFERSASYIEGDELIHKLYFGDYEIIRELDPNNQSLISEEHLYYVNSPAGLVAVVQGDGNQNFNTKYIYTDHLGSITHVLDDQGLVENEYSYDAWGRLRDTETGENFDKHNLPTLRFDRGYTGHEHLNDFGLVHMNGRLYDPILGRMLSPDNYVQDPNNAQNYNRYSYVYNNPLKYNDPSGEFGSLIASTFFSVSYYLSNAILGQSVSLTEAYNFGNEVVSGMQQASKHTIYSNDKVDFNIGIDMFSLSGFVSYSQKIGNLDLNLNAGVGLFGGFVGSANANYSAGDFDFNLGGGIGQNHKGWNAGFAWREHGLSYGRTYYGDAIGPDDLPNKQVTGTYTLRAKDFSARIENDYFGGRNQDRWRSNALEFQYKNIGIGTHLYNNDPKNTGSEYDLDIESPLWGRNRLGKMDKETGVRKEWGGWVDGYTYTSPLYFSIKAGNSVSRIGYSHPVFQDVTQNFVHKYPVRQHYYANYRYFKKGMHFHQGWDNPYSIWGK